MNRTRTALALLLLASCQENEKEVVVSELQDVMILPAVPNRNIDILFVIDDSASMADKQAALVASFPQMIDTLAAVEGGLPSLHIGVVTSDMGVATSNGLGAPVPGAFGGCDGNGRDGELRRGVVPELGSAFYISDIENSDGTRTRNYTGDLRNVFSQLASAGAAGCGFEQPLHAMRRALENPANAGFIRPDANLAVVFLADEDDCSMAAPDLVASDTSVYGPLQSFRCTRFGVTCDGGGSTPDDMNVVGTKTGCHANASSTLVDPVQPYIDYLTGFKDDPNRVMVSAIIGEPTLVATELQALPSTTPIPTLAHSCAFEYQGMPEVADPGVRLAEVVSGFPLRGDVTSICSADLTGPMVTIGATAKSLVGDPCIAAPLADMNAEAGIQPQCEVYDGARGAEVEIPPCGPGQTGSCWSIVQDTAKCAGVADNLRLQITRPSAPTSEIYSHLRCLTR